MTTAHEAHGRASTVLESPCSSDPLPDPSTTTGSDSSEPDKHQESGTWVNFPTVPKVLHGRNENASEGVQIICVGLMRTGLKTLHTALKDLDYTRIFDQENIVSTYELWNDVMENRGTQDTFANIFQGAQVAIGMPVFCFWEHILEINPNAKVILTVRDEDEWWNSVQRVKSSIDKDLPGAPLSHGSLMQSLENFLSPSYHRFCNVLRFAWNTALGSWAHGDLNEHTVRSNYRKHNNYVKEMLQGKQTSRGEKQLLVYDVRDGWEPLCEFLGKDIPRAEFPAVKNVPYFPTQQRTDGCDGCGIEELLVPESEFGTRMRQELRRGLFIGLGAVALVLAPIVALLHSAMVSQVPPLFLALCYLALVAVGWEVYVVMHSVVMRVPALVVLPMMMKSLLIAGALQGCFITYGILKEMIVVQDHVASSLLTLSSRVLSVLMASCAMLVTEGRVSFGGVPLTSFLAFGITNEFSTLAGYKMLQYLAFPVQVMAKSCKLLPSMVMGRALNGTKYDWWQYAQAIGAMVCVGVMHLSEEHKEPDGGASGWAGNLIAISLLVIFFVCDSFTSQYQTALYKKHPDLSQTQMMLAGNSMGLLISLIFVVSSWSAVTKSLLLMVENPAVAGRLLLLGLSGALGQFCIYTAIKVLGPLAFTWMMTVRQLLSVLISLVVFGHSVTPVKLTCILTVFAIMSSKQLSRAYHAMRNARGCGPSRVGHKGHRVAAASSVRRLVRRVTTMWEDTNVRSRRMLARRASTMWGDEDSSDSKED